MQKGGAKAWFRILPRQLHWKEDLITVHIYEQLELAPRKILYRHSEKC